MQKTITFEQIIQKLNDFWQKQGCIIGEPYGVELGAATNNPHTFFGSLGERPLKIAYIEPCRRPADARYGENPNRVGRYFQYQVILKPAPSDNQALYLKSIEHLGISKKEHDFRFVEDNWEAPSLGASGLGWEVWLDGMEISQYTYFQKMATLDLKVIPVEITYGLERLAMYLQGKKSIFDIQWNDYTTYGDLYREREKQDSSYGFDVSDKANLRQLFSVSESELKVCLDKNLYYPAYDYLLKMSHVFNLFDARKDITQTQRVEYLGAMRDSARLIALAYLKDERN